MRSRFVVIGIAGVVVLFLVGIIFMTLPEEQQKTEVTLRQDMKEYYTPTEKVEVSPYEEIRDAAERKAAEDEVKRLQEIIQKNESEFSEDSDKQTPVMRPEGTPVKKKLKTSPAKKKPKSESVSEPVPVEKKRRGFNSINLIKQDESNAIKAFVHSTQTVMVGSTLKMQLAENCLTDDGKRIRKGSPVYGEVTAIDGERVIIKISSININNNILPFKKNVYSRDAIEGIYVPGNPKSDVSKDAGAAAISGSGGTISGGLDMGSQIAAGAANSVINATKTATSKNIRKIKVTIKTNYQILLMEDKK